MPLAPEIIDSHAHLTWDLFAEDQGQVIARAAQQNVVQMVQAGVTLDSLPEMVGLADRYPQIFFGAGLHPHESKHWTEDAEQVLRTAAIHPKMVAIGECGLDFHYNHSERSAQIYAFRRQVQIAVDLGKPLIIHTRDAWEDTFAILREVGRGQARGVFHCYTGTEKELAQVKSLDFYVSFSGIVTFNNATEIQKAAIQVPANRIMVETDCPYLAPHPLRGARNEPANVWLIAGKLAQLRGCTMEEIAGQTCDNTRRLFNLPGA